MTLSTTANERLQTIRQSKKAGKVDVVQLPDDLYNHWQLSFNVDKKTEELLFDQTGTKLVIARTNLEVLSEDEIAWSGDILYGANEETVGNVTLIQRQDGSVTGTIDVEGVFYEIRSLGSSGLHAVRQADMSYVKELSRKSDVNSDEYKGQARPDSSKMKKQESTGSATIQQYRCSPEYHRLLVLNTQAAAQGRDIDGIVSLAIQETNESYNNSQIDDLRIAEAHQQQINFNETSDIDTDLDNLLANVNVQNLRNQHDADVVILLTDGNYGNITGAAEEILATEGTAYAIVEADHATGPDYTFPHELGHLQGAQHHPDDPTDPNGPFSYGFGHRFSYKGSIFVPRRYRSTIMAYECRPASQDPFCETPYYTQKYISNPDVEYQDVDTGIPGERENWQVLENTAIEVADFRDENELRTGYSQSGNPSTGQYTFTAQPCGGQSGYSYEWRVSYDNPYNYGGVVGTNQSLSWTFPEGQHFARVRVTSGASQEAFATAQVYVTGGSCPPGEICSSEKKASGFEEEIPDEVQLNSTYPNPFNPNTVISFSLPESQDVNVTVYDMVGREVAVLADEQMNAGTHRLNFNASNLSSGVYFVRLQTGQQVKSQQITLLK